MYILTISSLCAFDLHPRISMMACSSVPAQKKRNIKAITGFQTDLLLNDIRNAMLCSARVISLSRLKEYITKTHNYS